MPTFTKVADFVKNLLDGDIDLDANNIAIALSNTAPASESSNPTSAGNGVLANVTQISYTNYTDTLTTDRRLANSATSQSGGTSTFDADDFTITASGGSIATFEYIYIYDDTAAGDPLIALITLDAAETLTDGNSITITFNASGILSLA